MLQQGQKKKTEINKNQIKHKQIKPKQPLTKKERNVEKQELSFFVCKQTSKVIQIDGIVCRTCTVWVHEECGAIEAYLLCE